MLIMGGEATGHPRELFDTKCKIKQYLYRDFYHSCEVVRYNVPTLPLHSTLSEITHPEIK